MSQSAKIRKGVFDIKFCWNEIIKLTNLMFSSLRLVERLRNSSRSVLIEVNFLSDSVSDSLWTFNFDSNSAVIKNCFLFNFAKINWNNFYFEKITFKTVLKIHKKIHQKILHGCEKNWEIFLIDNVSPKKWAQPGTQWSICHKGLYFIRMYIHSNMPLKAYSDEMQSVEVLQRTRKYLQNIFIKR